MSATMDNCCGCGASRLSAAVRAVFNWPGWLPFTWTGSFDTHNVRYRTLTITIFDDVGMPFTRAITCNALNGCMADSTTGVAAPLTFTTQGLRTPAWPPDSITDTLASWASGEMIELSDPLDAAWCGAEATALLGTVALGSLTLGVDSRHVTYDAVFTAPGAPWSIAAHGIVGYLSLGVWFGAEDPPGSGIYPPYYAWGNAVDGTLYTTDGAIINAAFNPFENVTPAVANDVEVGDSPPTPGSANYYQQDAQWMLRKSISDGVGAPVCCEDDYYFFGAPPSPLCQMVADDGAGHLVLNPPALTFLQADNSRMITRTPFFGTGLTGGGCPCV